jgi:hypothetical protein
MRYLFLIISLFLVLQCYSQPGKKIVLSAIVAGPDSVPISNVAITNISTGKTVRTNDKGFFQTEIAANDSIFIYHIAYKRRFANKKDDGKLIILEPEVHELMQVNVTDKNNQELKNLIETVRNIKRLAPMKTNREYDMKSKQNDFIEQNGSHEKGFSPYFGPTIRIPLREASDTLSKAAKNRQQKKKIREKKTEEEVH